MVSIVDPAGKETAIINNAYGALCGVGGGIDDQDQGPPSGIHHRSCEERNIRN